MLNELTSELKSRGADFVKAVDISKLPESENRGYGAAVLIGIALSPGYVRRLTEESATDYSEYAEKEHAADELAEWAAEYIKSKGYGAFAQSEKNISGGFFDPDTKTSALPHKKIAVLAGLGWIGKSNLLVTREYGSAFCMCSVLTDAPLHTQNPPVMRPECGECYDCRDICPEGAIHGTDWEEGMDRDLIVDVYRCRLCLKCMINCALTQTYMKNSI